MVSNSDIKDCSTNQYYLEKSEFSPDDKNKMSTNSILFEEILNKLKKEKESRLPKRARQVLKTQKQILKIEVAEIAKVLGIRQVTSFYGIKEEKIKKWMDWAEAQRTWDNTIYEKNDFYIYED